MLKHTPWQEKNRKQKVVTSITSIILVAALGVGAYAAADYFFHFSRNVHNTRGIEISGEWTDNEIAGKEVLPGSAFQISQEITNTSTEPVYVFVRIDTEENAYSISDLKAGWTVAKESDGVILLAYGSSEAMTEVAPDAKVGITGKLTLDVTNAEFSDLDDTALDFTINACGVGKSQCDTHYLSPADVYAAYEMSGGIEGDTLSTS